MTKIAPSREPCYCESLQTYLLLTTGGHIEQTKQDYWSYAESPLVCACGRHNRPLGNGAPQ